MDHHLICLAVVLLAVFTTSLFSLSWVVISLWQCHLTSCTDKTSLNIQIAAVAIIGGAYLVFVPWIFYRYAPAARQGNDALPVAYRLETIREDELRREAREIAKAAMPANPPPSYSVATLGSSLSETMV